MGGSGGLEGAGGGNGYKIIGHAQPMSPPLLAHPRLRLHSLELQQYQPPSASHCCSPPVHVAGSGAGQV